MHQYLNPNAIKNYYASQKLEAHRFVRRLIDSPEDFLHHTRQCVLLSCFYNYFSSLLDPLFWDTQCSSPILVPVVPEVPTNNLPSSLYSHPPHCCAAISFHNS